MAEVTVCVPAYRSAAFIAQTLRSIGSQTFTDFVVDVAMEPDGADAAMAACGPFLDDKRFRLRVNPLGLGWDVNIRSLLRCVETPYFTVLPHDDAWHPRYLEALLDALRDRPDASVAYADMYLIGDNSGTRSMDLPDAGLPERLLRFFLGGAEAVPWRGVARSGVLDREFPGNQYHGFAVECEWAVHLIQKGVALRVRQPLYLKRARRDAESVSAGWRFAMPETTLRAALEHHRGRMLDAIARSELEPEPRAAIEQAAEAAMLRRWVLFSGTRFDLAPEQRERADLLLGINAGAGTVGRLIRSRALLALSRHSRHHGDPLGSRRLAAAAVEDDPDNWEAAVHLARSHLAAGRPFEALALAVHAGRLAPMAVGLSHLEAECTRQLERMYSYEPRNAG